MSAFHIVLPARYDSKRFPGKLLKEIHGISVLQRTYHQAELAGANSIVIATDHTLIAEHARSFGASVIMTANTHQSGTDRIAEVVANHPFSPRDIIVNLQADEPFMPPELIKEVAKTLTLSNAPMATLCYPIEDPKLFANKNVVKVVFDAQGYALYFSRSAIPMNRDNPASISHVFKHIGLYAYRAAFLLDFVALGKGKLEQMEALEQLRVLEAGFKIKVEVASVCPLQDINTKSDLIKAVQRS